MSDASERIPVEQAQRPLFIGVDVGGTSIKLGLVDNTGRTIGRTSIPTDESRGPADAVGRIHGAASDLLDTLGVSWDAVAAVGLGTPGSMDIAKGMILEPPNMPHWRYFPLRDALSERCGKPVGFANDANAAAFGEYWVGSGRQFASMVMFTLGTGVGGGIIVDGVSLDGEHSFGSELGHLVIDQSEDARLCAWGGGRGQLEAYASAPAVIARAEEALEAGRTSSVQPRIAAGERLTPKMMFEEAERDDAFSMDIILQTARHLSIGVVNAVHTVDPGGVIIGGAMTFGGHASPVGRKFLEVLRQEFQQRAYHIVAETTVIDFASLGSHAGYLGAAGIARAKLAS